MCVKWTSVICLQVWNYVKRKRIVDVVDTSWSIHAVHQSKIGHKYGWKTLIDGTTYYNKNVIKYVRSFRPQFGSANCVPLKVVRRRNGHMLSVRALKVQLIGLPMGCIGSNYAARITTQ